MKTYNSLYESIKNGLIIVNCVSSLPRRFWAKVDKEGPIHPTHGQCWVWTPVSGGRYGKLKVNDRWTRPHRVSWLLHHGEITDGLFVLHRCDNKRCVNPDHLFLGDDDDNKKDYVAKGFKQNQRLTREQVLWIRENCDPSVSGDIRRVASVLGVNERTVHGVVTDRSFVNVR